MIGLDQMAELVNHHVAHQFARQKEQLAVQADAPASRAAAPARSLILDCDRSGLLPTLSRYALEPGR
jgi:hypothetical protein